MLPAISPLGRLAAEVSVRLVRSIWKCVSEKRTWLGGWTGLEEVQVIKSIVALHRSGEEDQHQAYQGSE